MTEGNPAVLIEEIDDRNRVRFDERHRRRHVSQLIAAIVIAAIVIGGAAFSIYCIVFGIPYVDTTTYTPTGNSIEILIMSKGFYGEEYFANDFQGNAYHIDNKDNYDAIQVGKIYQLCQARNVLREIKYTNPVEIQGESMLLVTK